MFPHISSAKRRCFLRESPSWAHLTKYLMCCVALVCSLPLPSCSFAIGRSTALVVDSGSTHTSVVPVHDGYALRGAFVSTPLGGDYVTVQCRSFLEQQGIEIVPPYMIRNKEVVKEKAVPIWTRKELPPLSPSYINYMNNVSPRNDLYNGLCFVFFERGER